MKEKVTERPVRVALISLGCAKNLVDAELMLGRLLLDGMEITSDAAQADAVIINTCSFIDSAQEESVDTILECAAVRQARNRGQGLIVAGCLPQGFRQELPRLLPEVDAFMGVDQVTRVTEVVRQALAKRAGKSHQTAGRGRRPKSEVGSQKSEVPSLGAGDGGREAGRRRQETGGRGQQAQVQGSTFSPRPERPSSFLHPRSSILAPPSSLPPSPSPWIEVSLRPRYIPDCATPRFRLTPRQFAYLKIAEGCNHPCSFCLIPRLRGSHRSRAQADIVAEARVLLADGVKELNLISQDSTYYGLDLRPQPSRALAAPDKYRAAVKGLPPAATTICTLLRELNALPGDFWIRLLYTHPAHWTDDLVQTIADCPKVARYVDLPIQHIHADMLERMRRETSPEYILDLLRRIRAGIPGLALRTTFIVGFPGETEQHFQALLDFIRATRFERLGVFTYSQQAGTRAGKMAGQLPDKVKRHRRDLALAVQQEVAVEVAESFLGRTLKVLVENEASAKELQQARIGSWEHGRIRGANPRAAQLEGHYLLARGEADAPDIDGRVYVRGQLPLGEFARVRVTGHTDYDLIAEPA